MRKKKEQSLHSRNVETLRAKIFNTARGFVCSETNLFAKNRCCLLWSLLAQCRKVSPGSSIVPQFGYVSKLFIFEKKKKTTASLPVSKLTFSKNQFEISPSYVSFSLLALHRQIENTAAES